MSKWYKVEVPTDCKNDLIEIEDFLNKSNLEGRWKRGTIFKINIPRRGKNDYRWCFKFKDETDAMAFKLRWL